MNIKELVSELVAQVNSGDDIANQDAAALFRWLDKNCSEWRELTKRATPDREHQP